MKKIKHPLLIVLGIVAALGGYAIATAGYKTVTLSDIVAFENERVQAVLGSDTAKIIVAKFYFTGTHVTADDARGAKWVECAAENGDTAAMGILGILHMGGIGVEQSFPKAREWLTKSKEKNATDLAALLETFDKAIEILPPAEKEAQIKSNYEAAAKDMKAALLNMMEQME